MPRYTYMQNSFSSGQISSKLEGRTDVAEYKSGLREMTNALLYKSGGVGKCPGLVSLDSNVEIPATSEKDLMGVYPFRHSDGTLYEIRIHLNAGASVAPKIQAIRINDGVDQVMGTTSGTNVALDTISNGRKFSHVQVNNVLVLTHTDGLIPPIFIWRQQTLTFQSAVYKEVNYDPNIDPIEVSYFTGHNFFPVRDANTTDITITPSGVPTLGATIDLVSSAPMFAPQHVGTVFLLDPEQTPTSGTQYITPIGYEVVVTAFISANAVTGKVVQTFTPDGIAISAAATTYWYEGAWSDRRGWPKLCSFYQNRLLFANTLEQPNTIWGSAIGNYGNINRYLTDIVYTDANFAAGTIRDAYVRSPSTPSAPFESTLSSQDIDNITWLSSGRNLMVGTLSNEFVVTTNQSFLSAATIGFVKQSSFGSSIHRPQEVDEYVYFISNDGLTIVESGYSEENGGFVSRDLSTLSDEMLLNDKDGRERYVKIQWDNYLNVLWILTDRGNVVGICLNKTSDIKAFFRRTVDGKVLDLVSFRGEMSGRVVGINDKPTHTVMYVDSEAYNPLPGVFSGVHQLVIGDRYEVDPIGDKVWSPPTTVDTGYAPYSYPYYMDYSVQSDQGGTVWSVNFPDGVRLTVVSDTGIVHELIVTGGNVTTPTAYDKIIYGIPYTTRIKTLVHEVGPNQILNSQGDIVRVDQTTLLLHKTYAASYGSEDTDLYDVEDIPTTGFTGRVQVDMPQNPDNDNRIVVESSHPLPMSILGLVLRGVNNQ